MSVQEISSQALADLLLCQGHTKESFDFLKQEFQEKTTIKQQVILDYIRIHSEEIYKKLVENENN